MPYSICHMGENISVIYQMVSYGRRMRREIRTTRDNNKLSNVHIGRLLLCRQRPLVFNRLTTCTRVKYKRQRCVLVSGSIVIIFNNYLLHIVLYLCVFLLLLYTVKHQPYLIFLYYSKTRNDEVNVFDSLVTRMRIVYNISFTKYLTK